MTSNYRTRRGEIDLVMQEGDTLVFVEVRYRKNTDYGSAIETIGHDKQGRILSTVQHYMMEHDTHSPVRIDVVGMTPAEDDEYEYEWIKNAITG